MQKILILFFLLVLSTRFGMETACQLVLDNQSDSRLLYREMKLDNLIGFEAFEQALTGYHKLSTGHKSILTLIDFTKPSTDKRFFVLDLKQKKVLFSSYVSHGRNSGENFATSFSNQDGSYKSSLGFFVTENTYQGKNGYSLVLDGLEEKINDRAKQRAIVIHGASYSDPALITSSGRLGRSLGCPALPLSVSKQVIDTIKGGSLLYIYADDQNYLRCSKIFSDM